MVISSQTTASTYDPFAQPASATGNAGGQEKSKASTGNGKELTKEDKKQVEELKKTDREVRAHEMAHMAAGAGLARGGVKFQYKNGPDGHQYAVGGEVSIDSSPVSGDPRATIIKMQRVQSAAMAPANPSGQDRQVAAAAAATAAEAQMELAKSGGQNAESPDVKGLGKNKSYNRNAQIQPIDSEPAKGLHLDLFS